MGTREEGSSLLVPGTGGVSCCSVVLHLGELLCNLAQLAYAALLGVEDDGRAARVIEVSRSMRDASSGLLEQLQPSGPRA